MRCFKDSTGEEWQLDLPFGEVARVLKESENRFTLLHLDTLLPVLVKDLIAFYDLLVVLVAPQLDAKGVTAAEFGKRMAGDVYYQARTEFFAEWNDFFRQLHRPDQARAVEFFATNEAKAIELLKAKVEAESPLYTQLGALAESKIAEVFETSFTSLRESADSLTTPGGSPGATSNDSGKATSGQAGKPSSPKQRSSGRSRRESSRPSR